MLLLVDANVLIDYCDSDPSILEIYSNHIQQIVTPSVVFDEVDQLDVNDCAQLNIQIFQEPMSVLNAAARIAGGLSFQDHVCLMLSQQNGWTCATNDKRLHRECSQQGVNSIWGLKIMIELVANNKLSKNDALNVVNQMSASNPFVNAQVIQKFQNDLKNV